MSADLHENMRGFRIGVKEGVNRVTHLYNSGLSEVLRAEGGGVLPTQGQQKLGRATGEPSASEW